MWSSYKMDNVHPLFFFFAFLNEWTKFTSKKILILCTRFCLYESTFAVIHRQFHWTTLQIFLGFQSNFNSQIDYGNLQVPSYAKTDVSCQVTFISFLWSDVRAQFWAHFN